MSRYDDDDRRKKPSDRTIAFDKFELPESDRPKKKKERSLYDELRDNESDMPRGRVKRSGKINGRTPQSPLAKFAAAVLPQADDPGTEKVRKAVLIMCVAALIGALIFLGWKLASVDKGGKLNDEIAEIAGSPTVIIASSSSYSEPEHIQKPITTQLPQSAPPSEEIVDKEEVIDVTPLVNTPLNIDFDKLTERNPDTRAWIKITGTLINNVVVQGDDNNYYIEHDFDGKKSVSGTVFSSYLNTWDGEDDNTILFGHNTMDGTGRFFSYLVHYVPNDASKEPVAFYKVHPTIMLSTPDGGCETYKIFAGIICNTQPEYGEVFDYINKTRFTSADDFNNFIIEIMDRSWFYTDVDLTYGDELLTLSTCWWPLGRTVDTRWVIFARKVRTGESEYVDTSKAYRNYQAKLFDYYYKRIGGRWAGSVWDRKKLLSL